MMPVVVTVNGTGVSRAIYPDIMQNPFQIGVGIESNVALGSAAATMGWQVEHTFDYTTVWSPTWNGTTAVWIANSGLNGTAIGSTANATSANGNYAFPVAAIRLNVFTTVNATTAISMVIIQATNAP